MFCIFCINNVSDLKVNPDNKHRVYRLYILKFWLSHCVNTIHAYFILLAPWHSGKTLEDTVKEAQSIDDMITGQLTTLTLNYRYIFKHTIFGFKVKEKFLNGRHAEFCFKCIIETKLNKYYTTDVIYWRENTFLVNVFSKFNLYVVLYFV